MLDWLNQLLTSGDTNFLYEIYHRYEAWFTAIKAYYSYNDNPQQWATSSAYFNAMQSYTDWSWHMAILSFLAFCLMAFFFYKIASSFVGFWRMR